MERPISDPVEPEARTGHEWKIIFGRRKTACDEVAAVAFGIVDLR